VPRVQAVVDALHISRIEIREAEAPEIKKYMNEKVGVFGSNRRLSAHAAENGETLCSYGFGHRRVQ